MRRSMFVRVAQAVCGLAVVVITADAAAAAAFARVLPTDWQQAAHSIIGAPAPEPTRVAAQSIVHAPSTPSPASSGPTAPAPAPVASPRPPRPVATRQPAQPAVAPGPSRPAARRLDGPTTAPARSVAPHARRSPELPRTTHEHTRPAPDPVAPPSPRRETREPGDDGSEQQPLGGGDQQETETHDGVDD